MKTLKVISAVLMVCSLLMVVVAVASAELYPETAKVVKVNYEEDTVTVETFTGFLFTFYGCEDWQEGDCASLIMEDNGTELIYDDEIIIAQYSAWELVNWQYCED